jgi:hypothetical protein
MDRREALKKLAVGGAIVAGGSLVLSSNAVAQSGSGTTTPLPTWSAPINGQGQGTLVLTAPTPPSGATGAEYQWEIRGCAVSQGRTLVVINAANNSVIARANNGSCPTTPIVTPWLPTAGSVIVRTAAGGSTSYKDLEPGNTVTIRLKMRWYNTSNQLVESPPYLITGPYPNMTIS